MDKQVLRSMEVKLPAPPLTGQKTNQQTDRSGHREYSISSLSVWLVPFKIVLALFCKKNRTVKLSQIWHISLLFGRKHFDKFKKRSRLCKYKWKLHPTSTRFSPNISLPVIAVAARLVVFNIFEG